MLEFSQCHHPDSQVIPNGYGCHTCKLCNATMTDWVPAGQDNGLIGFPGTQGPCSNPDCTGGHICKGCGRDWKNRNA